MHQPASAQAHTSVSPEPALIPVLSPSLDAYLIEAALWMVRELRRDGFTVDQVADFVAQHLADEVALHGRRAA